jgi:hypothetical protein
MITSDNRDRLFKLFARELGKPGIFGVGLAYRILPLVQFQQQVTVSRDAGTVLTELASYLATKGDVEEDGESNTSEFLRIFVVLGSGFLNMNPTIVYVEVTDARDNSCTILVTGAAKEGLIKQRSAKKAVNRVMRFLATIS